MPSKKKIDSRKRHGDDSGLSLIKKKPKTGRITNPNEVKKLKELILRDRNKLVARGSATAIGIRVVTDQLRTLNSTLRADLLSTQLPFGFGVVSKAMDRETELLDCLYQVREMISTLGFHLDLDNFTELPTYVPIVANPQSSSKSPVYHDLLNNKGSPVGKISLVGLVNRYSSALFSDHHGLLISATITGKPDLNIYYHSLDATHNFIGGTSVRSSSMLTFTGPSTHGPSLRGVVGFSRQLVDLMRKQPSINVIVLAEIGGKDANALVNDILGTTGWTMKTNNAQNKSGVNDIVVFYKSSLISCYSFEVTALAIGNSAIISCDHGGSAKCLLVGSHILNTQAKNKTVGSFMKEKGIGAIFGDTNISTKASSSLGSGFQTVESTTSVTDFLTLTSSNSAGDKMFDKLLVRTKGS